MGTARGYESPYAVLNRASFLDWEPELSTRPKPTGTLDAEKDVLQSLLDAALSSAMYF